MKVVIRPPDPEWTPPFNTFWEWEIHGPNGIVDRGTEDSEERAHSEARKWVGKIKRAVLWDRQSNTRPASYTYEEPGD